MKLFFYIPTLKSGGAEKQCSLIAASLKNMYGHDVEIVMTHAPNKQNANLENFERVTKAGIKTHFLAWYKFGDLVRMYKLFRRNRDSVLFCYMTFPNFFGGFVGRLAGVKAIYGGVRTDRLPPRFMMMEYFAHYLWTRGTIFNSWRARDLFCKKGFKDNRSLVISNAIETTTMVQLHETEHKPIRIITVGTFSPAKDYRTWLEVIRRCIDQGCVIEAVIIGYGELEATIRSWIAELELEDKIMILPGNNGKGIYAELAKADIYLNTSVREGTSNSILEAMRAGLPIVATDAGDNRRLVTDEFNGFVEQKKDVEAISGKLIALVGDREMRKRFGDNSRRRIADDYTVDGVAWQYQKLLEDL